MVAQNGGRGLALGVERAVQPDDAFGERAGLVGAEHVHAAEVLDRVQAAHNHAAFGHLLRAVSEGDADNGGQEFGRQADRQRQRKEQRVNGRLGEEDVDGQDDDDHHQHDLCQQITEILDAAFKLGLSRAQAEPFGNLTEHGGFAGLHDQDMRRCRCARWCP